MTTLLDKFKSDLPVITDDFKTFAKTYNDGLISTKSISDAGGWVKYAESIKVTDKELLKFLGDVDNGKRSIKDIDSYIQSCEKSSKGLGSAFAATAKNLAANIGIMLAITLAVQALSAAFDYLNVTMEEQEEIVDGLKTDIEGLKIEYDELNSKGNLTAQEEEKLKMLERQLAVKKELLAVEEKELAEKDLHGTGTLTSTGNLASINRITTDNFENDVQHQIDQLKEYRDTLSEVENFNTWGATGLVNMEHDAAQKLEDKRTEIMEQWQAYADSYNLIQKYMDAGVWDDDPERKKYHENLMKMYDRDMKRLQELADSIDLQLGIKIDVSTAKDYLVSELKNAGKYDEDWLNSLSDEEIQYLFRIEDIGKYSPEDLKDMISDLRKEAEKDIVVETKITTADVITELEGMSEGFEKVAEIYNDVKDAGDFDFSNLSRDSDFGAIFGETDGFEDFIDIISKSPDDINKCQSAFDDLVSSWFYAQSPLQNINDENKDAIVNWLKSKGVINAVEVADYALAKSKREAFVATRALKEGTAEEIQTFYDEATAAGYTKDEITQLEWALYNVSKATLNFDQQVNELERLYQKAFNTSLMISSMSDMQAGKTGFVSPRILAQQKEQAEAKLDAYYKEQETKIRPTTTYSAPSGSGGSGSGSSSSKKDPHIAEVDKYKNLTDAVDEYDRKLQQLERTYDDTDSIQERIGLKKAEIKLYQEQKDAIDALNKARDKEISDLVNKLRGQGFKIDYDPSTDNLLIHNREHINDLNQSIIEQYEEYIDRVDALNDANKDSADQWDELTSSIVEAGKELKDLEQEKFEDYIEGAEHLLRLMENRKDAFGKEYSVYINMMNATLKRWKDLATTDYQGNIDQIRELEEQWTDFYDARIEKEKEILGMQLDDNDRVLDGVIKVIDDQIKALDDQIDGLSKANDERKKALELQKAQAELDKARNQKTRHVLRKGVGWVWESDEDAIKEAKENLSDLEYESKVDDIEDDKEALEELKEKIEEIPQAWEDEQNRLLMIERFGADAEEKILSGRLDVIEDFKDDYIDIQEQIQDKTDELEEHTSAAYLNVVKAFENMAKLAGIGLDTGATTQKTQSSWYVNKDGTAPSQAKVNDIIYTKGGTYQITGKDENGKFTRKKLDNKSTPITDGMWGKKISEEVIKTTEDVTDSVENIIRVNEDLVDKTKKKILTDANLQKYIEDNSKYTSKEIIALMDNEEVMDMLSDYTDDNSDATEDNTDALYRFIDALANLELEVPLEEMTLENFDDSIMDETDQAYVKELQRAWNLAMEQGNIELANQIHAMADEARMRYLDDDPNNDYNAIAESISKLADSKYEYSYSTQIGGKNGDSEATQKYLDNISWLRGKADWSDDFIDRLDNVVDAIENGNGLTATVYEDQYGRTSTVIDYTDKKTPNTSSGNKGSSSSGNKTYGKKAMDDNKVSQSDRDKIAQAQKDYNDAKAKGDTAGMKKAHDRAEAIRNQNGYSGGDDGSENIKTTSANTKSVSENTKAVTYSGDSTNDNTDSTDNNTDSTDSNNSALDKNTASNEKVASALEKSNAFSGSSGGGGSSGSKGSSGSSSSNSSSNRVTWSKKDNGDGTTTHTAKDSSGNVKASYTTNNKKKAKGGLNLPEDNYIVNEKGDETIIEPDEGNWVRINTGSSVIPHEVSEKLWEFGENPKMFLSDVLGYDAMKMNQQIIYTGGGEKVIQYHIGSINPTLPNVTKPDEFWDEFTRNLPNEAKQWSSTGY